MHKGGVAMTKEYSSNFAPYMESMIRQKHNAGFSLKYMDKHLNEFDRFCKDYFPDKRALDKELVETWA